MVKRRLLNDPEARNVLSRKVTKFVAASEGTTLGELKAKKFNYKGDPYSDVAVRRIVDALLLSGVLAQAYRQGRQGQLLVAVESFRSGTLNANEYTFRDPTVLAWAPATVEAAGEGPAQPAEEVPLFTLELFADGARMGYDDVRRLIDALGGQS